MRSTVISHVVFPSLAAVTLGLALAVACASPQRPDGGRGLLMRGNTVSSLTALDQRGTQVSVGPSSDGAFDLTVVYFYPKDGTPGCTAEACAFRDVWRHYRTAHIQVLGVSNDSKESHAEFAKREQLPFSLVADSDGTWATAFGVSSFAGFYSRVTFLVDRDGTVLKTYSDVDPGLHANEILQDARQFRAQRDASPSNTRGTLTEVIDPLAPAPRLKPAELSVRLELTASAATPTATGEHEFWLGATLTPPQGSHLYWKHSGETGLPTHIEFIGPRNMRIGETQYPGPVRFVTEQGQVGYGYAGPVTIVARVTAKAPPSNASFQVVGTWLSCDVRCVREQGTARLELHAGDGASALSLEPVLASLPRPGRDAGITAHFDDTSRLLRVETALVRDAHDGSSENWRLEINELFPEQDLGPDDRVPERQTKGADFATWKWHSTRKPDVLVILGSIGSQKAYYHVEL